MRDLRREHENLFQATGDGALEKVECAIEALFEDPTHSMHDPVSDAPFPHRKYDYEELLGALLSAQCALKENAQNIADLEREAEARDDD
jgi:hypothetical protein